MCFGHIRLIRWYIIDLKGTHSPNYSVVFRNYSIKCIYQHMLWFILACKCPCRRVGVPRYTEVTPEVVNKIQVETSLDLAVNKQILSAYIRLKTSVPNKKQVAKSIGYVGAAFLVVILGSIVLLDIPTLWKHLKHLINRITNFYRYMRHWI